MSTQPTVILYGREDDRQLGLAQRLAGVPLACAATPEELAALKGSLGIPRQAPLLICLTSDDDPAGVERMALASLRTDDVSVPVRVFSAYRGAFTVHTHPESALDKARRLVLAELAAQDTEAGAPPTVQATVGNRVLVVSDCEAGVRAAHHLSQWASVTLLLDGERERFPANVWVRAYRGRPVAIAGHVGAFHLSVHDGSGHADTRTLQADQVIVLWEEGDPPLRERTGVRVVTAPDAETVARACADVESRIGAFTHPVHVTYDTALCAGGAAERQSCGVCIPACPYDAIRRDGDTPTRIAVEELACEACGACVAACPTGALQFVGPSGEAVHARIAAALEASGFHDVSGGRVIALHCSRQGRLTFELAGARGWAYPATVHPVEVPCLRYISDADLLRTLSRGAAAVALLGCAGCRHGEREVLLRNLATAQDVLTASGVQGESHLRLIAAAEGYERQALEALRAFAAEVPAPPIAVPMAEPSDAGPRGKHAWVGDFLAAMQAGRSPAADMVATYAHAGYGDVEIRAEGCTLCQGCSSLCPTGALRFDERAAALRFAHLSCVGCGLCEQICPERVVRVHPRLRLHGAGAPPVTLVQDEPLACEECGREFATRRAVEAVAQRISAVDAVTEQAQALLRTCPQCRQAGMARGMS